MSKASIAPGVTIKKLTPLKELQSEPYSRFMDHLNQMARTGGLLEYTTYSRLWEYPWLWFQLEPFKNRHLHVLDIGSERSAFPWFLATQGFQVIISDTTLRWWDLWQAAGRKLGIRLHRRVLDSQSLNVATSSVDIFASVSVIEHIPDKGRALEEAARVLKPGGLLVMSFDICEPDMGMTFPEWNGKSLSMREFDDLFRDSPWFEPGVAEIKWNTEVIPEYLAWNRTTAAHHNYVTGAAVLRRNNRIWQGSPFPKPDQIFFGWIPTHGLIADRAFQERKQSARQKASRVKHWLLRNVLRQSS